MGVLVAVAVDVAVAEDVGVLVLLEVGKGVCSVAVGVSVLVDVASGGASLTIVHLSSLHGLSVSP